MAIENIAVNSPQTVKQFARDLFYEAIEATYFRKFIGKDPNSLLCERDELSKSAGDAITLYLTGLLEGDGVQGTDVLKGNEQASQTFTDTMVIDKLRQAVSVRGPNSIVQQRVPRDLREQAKMQLKDWWASRFDVSVFNQLAGNTAQTNTKYTGLQATIAPSVGRHYIADVSANNDKIIKSVADQTVGAESTDLITVEGIRALANIAKQRGTDGNFRMRPIMMGGSEYYVMFMHLNQARDLQNQTSASGGWYDIQRALLEGGEIMDNPIFNGALGMVGGVILHQTENIPNGVNSSTGAAVANTRRAVLCGAQAAHIAFGKGGKDTTMDWAEELDDYGEVLGVAAGCNWGAKKSQYNSKDYSTCVLTTYSADT